MASAPTTSLLCNSILEPHQTDFVQRPTILRDKRDALHKSTTDPSLWDGNVQLVAVRLGPFRQDGHRDFP